MNGLHGYVYDSISPHMPIVAAIFDRADDLIKMKVVATAEEGTRFISETLAAYHPTYRPVVAMSMSEAVPLIF